MAINSQVGWKTRNVDFSLFPPVLISRFPMRHDLAAVNLFSLFAPHFPLPPSSKTRPLPSIPRIVLTFWGFLYYFATFSFS